MDLIDSIDVIGVKDGIKKCFSSVFTELNVVSEAWFQKTKLLTIGRENYADHIATKVGVFRLFGTSRNTSVDSSYVRVNISTEIERERYRSVDQIERTLRQQRLGQGESITSELALVHWMLSNQVKTALRLLVLRDRVKLRYSVTHLLVLHRGKIRGKRRIPFYLAVRDLGKAHGIFDAL